LRRFFCEEFYHPVRLRLPPSTEGNNPKPCSIWLSAVVIEESSKEKGLIVKDFIQKNKTIL
jgi:hypothetical protein